MPGTFFAPVVLINDATGEALPRLEAQQAAERSELLHTQPEPQSRPHCIWCCGTGTLPGRNGQRVPCRFCGWAHE